MCLMVEDYEDKVIVFFFLRDKETNLDPLFKNYPAIVYHGYHQRRVGCMAGGNRSLYIDSEGYANACPFCQTKNCNIKDVLTTDFNAAAAVKANGCQAYENAL
jgi:hypothetical protein